MCNGLDAFGREQRESSLAHAGKGGIIWNRAVDEQAQDLTRGFQVSARFGERVLRRLARSLPRSLLVVVDETDEGLDQAVVDLAKAVAGEAQQVQARDAGGHATQPVDGVEGDERGIVADAVRGDAGGVEKPLGECVKRCEERSAFGFLLQFLVAEVLWFALEERHLIDRVVDLEHRIELLRD